MKFAFYQCTPGLSYSTVNIHKEILNIYLEGKFKSEQKMVKVGWLVNTDLLHHCCPMLAFCLSYPLALCHHIHFMLLLMPSNEIWGQSYLGPQISSYLPLEYEDTRLAISLDLLDFIKIWVHFYWCHNCHGDTHERYVVGRSDLHEPSEIKWNGYFLANCQTFWSISFSYTQIHVSIVHLLHLIFFYHYITLVT